MRPKKLVLALLLLLLASALWYLSKPGAPLPQAGPPPVQTVTEGGLEPSVQPPTGVGTPAAAPGAATPPMTEAKPGEVPVWELKIDEALRSNAEPPVIAQVLLQQIPSMPKEGQVAAAQHIVNLIPDKDHLNVMPYVRNTNLEPGFQEIIVAESFNRPDEVKLPLLLAAAQTPKHPMAEVAKSTLGFLLDWNYGDDWGRWEAAVVQFLADKSKN